LVRFDVFTAVTMKNAVFWDVVSCLSCVNRRFGGTSGDYEECRLLGCGVMFIMCEPTFRWNVGSHKIYTAPHPRRRHSSIYILVGNDSYVCSGKWPVSFSAGTSFKLGQNSFFPHLSLHLVVKCCLIWVSVSVIKHIRNKIQIGWKPRREWTVCEMCVNRRKMLNRILRYVKMFTGLNWLRMWTSGGLLRIRKSNFEFHKRRRRTLLKEMWNFILYGFDLSLVICVL
jgi:hypothetical protein